MSDIEDYFLSTHPNSPRSSELEFGYVDDEGDFIRISSEPELRVKLTEAINLGQSHVLFQAKFGAAEIDDSSDDSFEHVEHEQIASAPSSSPASPTSEGLLLGPSKFPSFREFDEWPLFEEIAEFPNEMPANNPVDEIKFEEKFNEENILFAQIINLNVNQQNSQPQPDSAQQIAEAIPDAPEISDSLKYSLPSRVNSRVPFNVTRAIRLKQKKDSWLVPGLVTIVIAIILALPVIDSLHKISINSHPAIIIEEVESDKVSAIKFRLDQQELSSHYQTSDIRRLSDELELIHNKMKIFTTDPKLSALESRIDKQDKVINQQTFQIHLSTDELESIKNKMNTDFSMIDLQLEELTSKVEMLENSPNQTDLLKLNRRIRELEMKEIENQKIIEELKLILLLNSNSKISEISNNFGSKLTEIKNKRANLEDNINHNFHDRKSDRKNKNSFESKSLINNFFGQKKYFETETAKKSKISSAASASDLNEKATKPSKCGMKHLAKQSKSLIERVDKTIDAVKNKLFSSTTKNSKESNPIKSDWRWNKNKNNDSHRRHSSPIKKALTVARDVSKSVAKAFKAIKQMVK